MRSALAIACVLVSVACNGQSLSKSEAEKLINRELRKNGDVRGTVTHVYVKADLDATNLMAPFEACKTAECLDAKALRDRKLATISADTWENGRQKYFVNLTPEGEKYKIGDPTERGWLVRAGDYRVGKINSVNVQSAFGQTNAEVYFTQRFEPTPFYGLVYLRSGEGKRVRDDGQEKIARFTFDGKKWRRHHR
jgi:hypothetical protein